MTVTVKLVCVHTFVCLSECSHEVIEPANGLKETEKSPFTAAKIAAPHEQEYLNTVFFPEFLLHLKDNFLWSC